MPVHMIDCVQALHCESHNEPAVRDSGKYSSSQIAEMGVTVSRRPGRRVCEVIVKGICHSEGNKIMLASSQNRKEKRTCRFAIPQLVDDSSSDHRLALRVRSRKGRNRLPPLTLLEIALCYTGAH
jgi:hypothetical protein